MKIKSIYETIDILPMLRSSIIGLGILIIVVYAIDNIISTMKSKSVSNSLNLLKRISIPNENRPFLMITSIGNPENQYQNTRHSVGHSILHEYARRNGFNVKKSISRFEFLSNENKDNIILYETQGYMNLSGKNLVQPWSKILELKLKENFNPVLIVLHDELDLELGKVKVRKQNSSHRGHNGLKDIQKYIGKGYSAVQIGIGRNYQKEGERNRNPNIVADYVLSKFKPEEKDIIDEISVEKVSDIIEEMENGKYIFDKQWN